MEIYGRKIGPDQPPYFVAEIGANHDGDLDRAYRLITYAAESGADAVKFQHFQAATIVSRRGFEELAPTAHQAGWDDPVYEVYQKAEVPLDWTEPLANFCHKMGVAFITTPYSLELADAVEPYVDAFKIGSGDVTWHGLITHVARKRKPVLLATGASTVGEVNAAVHAVWRGDFDTDLVLMQCNTNYDGDDTNLRYANLRFLAEWKSYAYDLGLSDHTRGAGVIAAAITLGASVFERHFTDNPTRPGPDHAFAMTPEEWRNMVEAAYDVWEALGDGVKKVEENEEEARIVQRRALRYKHSIVGRTTAEDFIATRPCPEGALEPYRLNDVAGRVLKHGVEADTLVRLEDFE